MTDTAAAATFLAANTAAIARSEDAGQIYTDIHNAVTDIERIINRPPSPKYCGNCPTITDQHRCDEALLAKREDTEVTCWKCKTTHNVERLIERALAEVHDWLWTQQEILDIMAQIGEPISPRTWRHWRATGKIMSRNELGAEPKYYIEEVRHLRATYAHARAS
jgi:hypothetical protein